jgi:hypothetical protein
VAEGTIREETVVSALAKTITLSKDLKLDPLLVHLLLSLFNFALRL